MEKDYEMTDRLLFDASGILLLPTPLVYTQTISHSTLRRSPRKHASAASKIQKPPTEECCLLVATSNQRRQSPTKRSPSKRCMLGEYQEPAQELETMPDTCNDRPMLQKAQTGDRYLATAGSRRDTTSARYATDLRSTHVEAIMLPLSKTAPRTDELTGSDSESSFILGSARPKARKRSSSERSVMSLMTEAARNAPLVASPTRAGRLYRRKHTSAAANKFVLGEAACLADLADSDANNEGEDEDTDLSGFVVDDDAELSYHESMESNNEDDDDDSEYERRSRKVKIRQQSEEKKKPRRRLQRGRRRLVDSDEEDDNSDRDGDNLVKAFDNMNFREPRRGTQVDDARKPEVIDLVTPPSALPSRPAMELTKPLGTMNLLNKLNALRLSPPTKEKNQKIPAKVADSVPALTPTLTSDGQTDEDRTHRPTTPAATSPRSPSKLKSPSKLLSPSKRGDLVPRSPHRPSMDAFWDLNVVNEWNDQFSPKKASIDSPRKGLKHFDIWSDSDENDSLQKIEESSDGLPSPCESPTKMRVQRSPLKSPEKVAQRKAQEERKAKLAKKKAFDASKDAMAWDLFESLDKHITNGQISKMAESTGGVAIVWSNTLRSTAGRANWKKTKTTSSPNKNGIKKTETIRHFASIDLAIKVIDRPERLYDTLAHEFCHLANFMISGVLKEPHGAQFQRWAKQATTWLHISSGRPEWESIKITTKHGYVIEHKYLWACSGRANIQNMTFKDNTTDDNVTGCGAEYGRHSKSIDTDKHRCGVCHGILVQVRPTPRASPKKNKIISPAKKITELIDSKKFEETVKQIQIVELS